MIKRRPERRQKKQGTCGWMDQESWDTPGSEAGVHNLKQVVKAKRLLWLSRPESHPRPASHLDPTRISSHDL